MLHELTMAACLTESKVKRSRMALVTASLHIVGPAGMFLSAPYAESLFSFLNFFGFWLYSKTLIRDRSEMSGIIRGVLMLFTGINFGVATTVRGNGLLSGLILVYDAVRSVSLILCSCDSKHNIQVLISVCLSGGLMACIATLPQYLAYSEYCHAGSTGEDGRPWCSQLIPSIYAWVQKEYW